jgi:monoamine oxidase
MPNNQTLEVPYQSGNPTDQDRYTQLKYVLNTSGRPEDFENVIDILSPPEDITTICPKGCGKSSKVAIIGAGAAGLSAAYELRKIGCDVTIFEATNRIGGRIYTHYFGKEKKYYAELGPMRVPASHETTWHYLNLFNLSTHPFPTKNINGLFYVRDAHARNDPEGISVMNNIYPRYKLTEEEERTPWMELADRIYDKYLLSLPPEIRKQVMEIRPYYADSITAIDKMNYRTAYESTGLSQDAIAMLGYLSTFDLFFFNISLTELLQHIYTADFAFTYGIDGGLTNLTNSFYKELTSENPETYEGLTKDEIGRVTFRMKTAIDGIYENSEINKITLECRTTEDNVKSFETFDYVVCAIPFTSLRRVDIQPKFSVRKMQAIRELNFENAQKTFFLLKDRFWEMGSENQRIVGGSSSTSLPNISTYYPPDHAMAVKGTLNAWTLKSGASPYEPGPLLASYNWGEDAERLGNENGPLRIMDIKEYIEKIHCLPEGFIDKKLLSWVSIFWPNVEYIWTGGCFGKPGDKTLFSHVITLPEMNDRVFFAGEHISQKHVWLQGALQTGMNAANGIAARIKNRDA